jgi:hypothetical protein
VDGHGAPDVQWPGVGVGVSLGVGWPLGLGVFVGVGSAVGVEAEKAKTARTVRRGALEASATATTLRGFADGVDIIDDGIRRVAVRSAGCSPTSPRVQRSWRPESERVQPGVCRVQEVGRSAVRCKVVPCATPSSAWTRTVYVSAKPSRPPAVTREVVRSRSSRTAGRCPSWTASAAGLASVTGTASAAPAAIAAQRVPPRTVPPSGLLHGCQGGGAAAPGTGLLLPGDRCE